MLNDQSYAFLNSDRVEMHPTSLYSVLIDFSVLLEWDLRTLEFNYHA